MATDRSLPPPARIVRARDGVAMPALGLGTWRMGESRWRRREEVAALRLGLDLGMTLIDTAELYGNGGAEKVVGEAIKGRRDEVFLITKVLPSNASRDGTIKAAERSLRRLGIDRIDLYLLHWIGSYPIAETLEAFARLKDDGKVRHYGVSNFYVANLEECERHPAGRTVSANQVKYSLMQRGIERDLLAWCAAREVAVMGYSALEEGRFEVRPALRRVAERHGVSPEVAAIAWTLRHPHVVAIPKAVRPEHVRANARAIEVKFSAEDLAELDAAYPA